MLIIKQFENPLFDNISIDKNDYDKCSFYNNSWIKIAQFYYYLKKFCRLSNKKYTFFYFKTV